MIHRFAPWRFVGGRFGRWRQTELIMLFPGIAMVLALGCAAVMLNAAWKRPTGAKVAWSIAFLLFTIAAACEVAGLTFGWSPTLVRVYYLSGAVLVVGFLALGELYLLFPRAIERLAPGATLLITSLAVTLVWDAPIDPNRLADAGWRALERGTPLVIVTGLINGVGTLVVVAGALWSTWRMLKDGGGRRRAIGCALIGVGVLASASGGWLTRFGRPEFLYVSMALGIALILVGCLQSLAPAGDSSSTPGHNRRNSIVAMPAPQTLPAAAGDHALDLVTHWLLVFDDDAIARRCLEWSATSSTATALDRRQARAAWALRLVLPEPARQRFDTLPVATRGMLSEAYHEVFNDGFVQPVESATG